MPMKNGSSRAPSYGLSLLLGRRGRLMNDFQLGFPSDRLRAQLGQKVDATAATVVSAHSGTKIPFGVLVVYDESDAFLCKLPAPKSPIDKPLGITLRQLHSDAYPPKS